MAVALVALSRQPASGTRLVLTGCERPTASESAVPGRIETMKPASGETRAATSALEKRYASLLRTVSASIDDESHRDCTCSPNRSSTPLLSWKTKSDSSIVGPYSTDRLGPLVSKSKASVYRCTPLSARSTSSSSSSSPMTYAHTGGADASATGGLPTVGGKSITSRKSTIDGLSVKRQRTISWLMSMSLSLR